MTSRWEAFEDRPNIAALVHGPVVLAQQLPLGTIPAALMNEQGPTVEKAPPPVSTAVLPADLPGKLRPKSDGSFSFVADSGGRTVVFRPLTDSHERFAVYNEVGPT